MYRVFLLIGVVTTTAQNPYGLDSRGMTFAGKSSNAGPLYSPGIGNIGDGYRDDSYEDNAVTPTPVPTSIHRPAQLPVYRKSSHSSETPIRILPGGHGSSIHGRTYTQDAPINTKEPLEDEKEEPDRLTLLLPQSKFDCVGKQTGYYADEDLNCEVFHYCQDNAKHSWICPEGFSFHQVHLICMPPNGDIMCRKSSQYHFVNEYLYKPLNQHEAESKPNVTLKYSERYFPGDIFTDEREPDDYHASSPQRQPLQQQPLYLSQQSTTLNSIPLISRPSSGPHSLSQYRLSRNQVFRSPEEVNIPLQQRRPHPQQQILKRYPQVIPNEEDYE